jgi:hypothetical protein
MRPRHLALLLASAAALAGCGQETTIGDRDTAALIRAIQAANASPGPDVIRLAPRGLYTLNDAPRDATSWLPPIRGELRIEGNGAEIRRYQDGQRTLLEVERDATVQVSDLAMSEGSDGAIRNFGTLRLDRVRITDSTGAGTPAIVLNYGVLEARDSEIAYNLLPTSRRDAGTVLNYGQLRLRDTAIHDNVAQRRFDSLAVAGAVLNLGRVEAKSARIADNEATDGEQPDSLVFPAVLNLGNGVVEGDLSPALVREAGMVAMAGR